jgi:ribosomal protein L29
MTKELKNKTEKELNKILAEAREEVRKSRFNLAGASAKSAKATREQQKNIARVLTELNNR